MRKAGAHFSAGEAKGGSASAQVQLRMQMQINANACCDGFRVEHEGMEREEGREKQAGRPVASVPVAG